MELSGMTPIAQVLRRVDESQPDQIVELTFDGKKYMIMLCTDTKTVVVAPPQQPVKEKE